MGVFKAIGEFLFGKDPDIFDDRGNVLHKLPKKKWDSWQNRMKTDPHYNWRNHAGTLAGHQAPQPPQAKN